MFDLAALGTAYMGGSYVMSSSIQMNELGCPFEGKSYMDKTKSGALALKDSLYNYLSNPIKYLFYPEKLDQDTFKVENQDGKLSEKMLRFEECTQLQRKADMGTALLFSALLLGLVNRFR